MTTFTATLTPMLTLFVCIALGFILSKCKILPEGSGKVMAKMETWIFCPALNFTTMAYFCTVDSIGEHLINIILSSLGVLLAVGIFFLRAFSSKKRGPSAGSITMPSHSRTADIWATPSFLLCSVTWRLRFTSFTACRSS